MTLRLSLKLIETDTQIKKAILSSIRDALDVAISKSLPLIKQQLQQAIIDAIKNESEYMSLKSGQLRYEFGIPDVSIVDKVIEDMCQGQAIKLPLKVNSRGISGGLKYIVIDGEKVSQTIQDPSNFVKDIKGYSMPWLKWLLTYGTNTIVKNFEVQLGPNPRSRSGMAIMVESSGSQWYVPAQFAGTTSNNWITRAITRLNDDNFSKIIQTNIEKNI